MNIEHFDPCILLTMHNAFLVCSVETICLFLHPALGFVMHRYIDKFHFNALHGSGDMLYILIH